MALYYCVVVLSLEAFKLWLYITVSSFSLWPVLKPSRSLGGLVKQVIVFFAFCHHKHTVLRLVAPCSLSPRAFPWAPLSDPLLSTRMQQTTKMLRSLAEDQVLCASATAQILKDSYRPSPFSALNSSRTQMNIKTFWGQSTPKSMCCCSIWQRKGPGTKSISVIAIVA